MNKFIMLLGVVLFLGGCNSTQIKPNKASKERVELSSMVLNQSKKGDKYGVLMGVYTNSTQANIVIERAKVELKKVGVKDKYAVVLPLLVSDPKNKTAIAVVAGQYPDLANAHYLQRILTRVVPGQYNLVTVPKNIWLENLPYSYLY